MTWIRLLFCKERESYLLFSQLLGFMPRDLAIYRQALLHKSTSVKSEKGRPLNNERLEFLGDAVLDAVVADIVYRHFPGRREGFLTDTRSKIVQRDTLNRLAVDIGLDRLVKSASHSSAHNNYMYGNAFEALIGAIYVDRCYTYCMRFVERQIIGRHINLDRVSRREVNFKSKLIEWSQKHRVELSFELIRQLADEHLSPVFQTEVRIAGHTAGEGTGYSKKESQQNAAKAALKRLKTDNEFRKLLETPRPTEETPTEKTPKPMTETPMEETPKPIIGTPMEGTPVEDMPQLLEGTPQPVSEEIEPVAIAPQPDAQA